MTKLIPGNQKHLSLDDRLYIEHQLDLGTSFKDIARFLCKDPTTISREVKKRRYSDWSHAKNTFFLNAKNFCVHRFHCQKTNVCNKVLSCGVKCRSCPSCNLYCKDFEKEQCTRLDKPPFVCNGCPKSPRRCTVAHKYRYNAKAADRRYRDLLSDCRSGINMTQKQLHDMDNLVSPLIGNGQSPYQIITNNPELGISVRTLYSYIERGILLAKNIHLKRKVKFKPRKTKKKQITNRSIFIGRTYADFLERNLSSYTQMDTVHSAKGSSKTLLTFLLTECKLFLAFLMNRNTTGAVKLVFNRLQQRLGIHDFSLIFKYILTDRGPEFGDPDSLESDSSGVRRSNIFYCDPMMSGQKGSLEQTHSLLRNVLPKRTNFEFLTQWDVNLIVNNINSTPRESLGGRTPYDMAAEKLGADVLKAFQLRPIPPNEVILKPKLIRFNR